MQVQKQSQKQFQKTGSNLNLKTIFQTLVQKTVLNSVSKALSKDTFLKVQFQRLSFTDAPLETISKRQLFSGTLLDFLTVQGGL